MPVGPAVLSAYDCWALLRTAVVARVAWTSADGVAIVPVNYAVADGALWFRTQPYSALGRQCGGGRIAVEVDQVDRVDDAAPSAWSVVVTGTAQVVPDADVPDVVSTMTVWAPGPRALVVRVDPVEVTGRRL